MGSRASHDEIELKRRLIGAGAADKLVAVLGPVAVLKRQINHVFDTEDRRLNQQRYSVRLRLEDGTPVVTAKGPSRGVGAHTSSRTEAEAEIESTLADEILAGRGDPVAGLRERETDRAYDELWRGLDQARDGRPLRAVGHFENQRRTVPVVLPSGLALTVEVDRTRFPDGRVDDEIEIEVPSDDVVSEVEAWLDERAAAAGVTIGPSRSKVGRFFAALRGAVR
ncbi:MAG: CYTH domain-containing protein [Candidatus Binatia bacterium]